MFRYQLTLITALFLASCISAQILNESFDDTTLFVTSVPFFSDGSGDYFTIDSGSNIGSFVNFQNADDRTLVAMDTDRDGGPDTVTVTWSSLNISGQTGLQFSVKVGEDAASDSNFDWDTTSFVHFDYAIDGDPFVPLIWFEATGTNTPAQEDTDFDGVGDGDTLTDTLAIFSANIPSTGSSMDIRITIGNLDTGDEDVGIDDLLLTSDQMMAMVDTNIIINEFSPCDQWVELKNLGDDTLDIGRFYLYNANNIPEANIGFLVNGSINSSVKIGPNALLDIAWGNIGTTFGEIGLFTDVAFADPTKILDYVAYNADQSANTASIAVVAGVWGPSPGTFIDAVTGVDCNSSSIKNTLSPMDATETDSSSWCETIPTMGTANGDCLLSNCVSEGALVITEIMNAPADSFINEYVEVYNTTGSSINLNGFILKDDDNDEHTIGSDVIVAGQDYAILARTNGGINVDYVYSDFFLSNGADEVVLACNSVVIDSVDYDDGATFPDVSGTSMSLDPTKINVVDNDDGANWCASTTTIFGQSDKGTPGMENDACSCSLIAEISNDACTQRDFGFTISVNGILSSDTFEIIDASNGDIIGFGMSPIGITLSMNVADTVFKVFARDYMDASCTSDTLMVQLTDCSGPICANPGDLVITEIMNDPSNTSDANGEYFEIYNASNAAIDLMGYVIKDFGSNSHTIDSNLTIMPNEYITLGRQGDTSLNQGIFFDYVYGSDIALANGDDEIVILCDGVGIDTVAYDGGPNFPDPTGASMILNPQNLSAEDNDNGANWCISTSTLSDGDMGTPGAENDACTSNDPCPPSYTMDNGNALMGAFNIDSTFTTPGDIESTQLLGTTETNITVIYSTPAHVTLDTPFEVNQGVIFEVNSDGCPE